MKINFKEVGLKCGLEFHQMLNTSEKLFCSCPTVLRRDKPDFTFFRRLRPTMSELGEIDPAALFEFKRGRTYVYEGYVENTCLVEMDEEPPHDINREAVEIALMIALLLNAKIVDEIQVMRKIVIDGSNTTGFQRTALIALGGEINIGGKKVLIQTICLEEDAARKVLEKNNKVYYRLDRLGIPLIEIATAPVIETPQEAEEVAFKIGQLLRITGRVKRGLGTIRQDINVSIKGGAKIEIKGVQKLELISKVVEYEALRQLKLLEIRDILRKRGLTKDRIMKEVKHLDISSVFENTKSRVIKNILKKGGVVYGLKVPKMRGVLGFEIQPGRRFGTEIADRVRYWTGLGGIIHSDEMPAYGISSKEDEKIREMLALNENDAYIILAGPKDKVEKAVEVVLERIIEALDGVPEETRSANPDGTTHFTRPRPGAARMYPETDIRPFTVTNELIAKIRGQLPETPDKKFRKFITEYRLSEDLAKLMLRSYRLDLFEKIVNATKNVQPSFIAYVLEGVMKDLRRRGFDIESLEDEKIIDTFLLLDKGIIAKEALPEILKELCENPDMDVNAVIEKLGLRKISLDELKSYVRQVIKEKRNNLIARREKAVNIVMGEVMKVFRGKVDGKIVYQVVSEIVAKEIGSS
ncbi:MAG: Glu-tRNA(Gln) amidotransferase GatDE subunit E [Thermoprotei archaeon]|nr:MAG: Glu-tRNA(Gln) amidotransferase GatDE subunit E [Thermoprotei archaeon]HDD63930.1 Glu-tRNA(Gln) amidotransferase subunit GatE [Thermoprotei archaeon]